MEKRLLGLSKMAKAAHLASIKSEVHSLISS